MKDNVDDVLMKVGSNMTGNKRPGMEDQTSLTGIAAEAIEWDYSRSLQEMLSGACKLEQLRDMKPVLFDFFGEDWTRGSCSKHKFARTTKAWGSLL